METLGDILVTETSEKTSSKFHCKKCDYKCCKKFNWNRHILTSKHNSLTLGDIKVAKNEQNEQKILKQNEYKYLCEHCQKNYDSRNGLWKHKQKCISKNNNEEVDNKQNIIDKKDELIKFIMQENKEVIYELKEIILEIAKKDSYNNCNNTNTNSHNKSFNLQFFLNETCKDAMNIMDFVDSIKLQLSDLERVGELGYVEGISNIIVKNLKEMDVTQRPVHCTDKKRETIYIKDEDKWEKDEEKKKMHRVIKKVADKNARLLPKFKEAHPDCIKSSSKFSDQYNKIIIESMGGPGDNDFEKEEKIIKKVSKEVTVEKEST
jgi:hypothetical protein